MSCIYGLLRVQGLPTWCYWQRILLPMWRCKRCEFSSETRCSLHSKSPADIPNTRIQPNVSAYFLTSWHLVPDHSEGRWNQLYTQTQRQHHRCGCISGKEPYVLCFNFSWAWNTSHGCRPKCILSRVKNSSAVKAFPEMLLFRGFFFEGGTDGSRKGFLVPRPGTEPMTPCSGSAES